MPLWFSEFCEMKHLIFKRADTTEALGQNVFHSQNTSHTSVFPLHLSHRPPLSGSPRPHQVSAGLWGREPHWQTPSGAGAWVCPGVHGTLGLTGEAAPWAPGAPPSQSAG